jgi:hypothetical protein
MVDLIQSLVFVYITWTCIRPIKRCAPLLDGGEEKEEKEKVVGKRKKDYSIIAISEFSLVNEYLSNG